MADPTVLDVAPSLEAEDSACKIKVKIYYLYAKVQMYLRIYKEWTVFKSNFSS